MVVLESMMSNMKLSPTDKSIPVSPNAQAPASKGGAVGSVAKEKTTKAAGVAVTVSTLARTLEAAKAGDTAEVDTAKVTAVRDALQKGTYTVNPEAIADKMLANAQELLQRTRS
jgi:negative regulator of flagellin synthesis FlgM